MIITNAYHHTIIICLTLSIVSACSFTPEKHIIQPKDTLSITSSTARKNYIHLGEQLYFLPSANRAKEDLFEMRKGSGRSIGGGGGIETLPVVLFVWAVVSVANSGKYLIGENQKKEIEMKMHTYLQKKLTR